MKAHFGPKFKKDKLKNRRKTYRRWYNNVKQMLNLSGFGWNEETRMVTAETAVWEDYIRASFI